MSLVKNGWEPVVVGETEATSDAAWTPKPKAPRKARVTPRDTCSHGVSYGGGNCLDCHVLLMVGRARGAQRVRRQMRVHERRVARLERTLELARVRLARSSADLAIYFLDLGQ